MRTLIRTLTYHRLQILELLLFAAKNEFNDVISSLTNTTVMKQVQGQYYFVGLRTLGTVLGCPSLAQISNNGSQSEEETGKQESGKFVASLS